MRKNAGPARNGLITALDVGSSKVCCFIARVGHDARPHVVGIGQQVSKGVKGGAVVDMEALESAILNAVHAAEQMAGDTIDRVVVNLSGGHPASNSIGVQVSIAGHAVGDGDLRRALEQGHQRNGINGNGQETRQLIHAIPVNYSIDGNRGVRDPRGMFGEQLGVNMHFVSAATGAIRNLTTCIQRCHLDVAELVVSPYASGLATLVEDESDLGVTIIDIGGGTTSIAVFLGGNVIFTDVLRVGGHHVTTDIARGLSTSLANAERIKALCGHAITSLADDREVIEVPRVGEEEEGQAQPIPRSLLVNIIQPRLEEIFELVRSRLEASGFDRLAGRRVVLTGGGAQLPGLRDLAQLILDKQVRIGRPIGLAGLAESTSGPAYATCSGLLIYAAAADGALPHELADDKDEKPTGPVGRIGLWLREHF